MATGSLNRRGTIPERMRSIHHQYVDRTYLTIFLASHGAPSLTHHQKVRVLLPHPPAQPNQEGVGVFVLHT